MVVYKHVRLDKNEPFYIGIGNLERAYTKRSRNKYWKHIVKSVPYKVEILFEGLSSEDACQKEIELIKFYGRKDLGTGILANLTDGGIYHRIIKVKLGVMSSGKNVVKHVRVLN